MTKYKLDYLSCRDSYISDVPDNDSRSTYEKCNSGALVTIHLKEHSSSPASSAEDESSHETGTRSHVVEAPLDVYGTPNLLLFPPPLH